jgi:hypothetical protein
MYPPQRDPGDVARRLREMTAREGASRSRLLRAASDLYQLADVLCDVARAKGRAIGHMRRQCAWLERDASRRAP